VDTSTRGAMVGQAGRGGGSCTEPSLEVHVSVQPPLPPLGGSGSYGPTGTLLSDSLQLSPTITPLSNMPALSASATISTQPCTRYGMSVEPDVLTQLLAAGPIADATLETERPLSTFGAFSSILQATESTSDSSGNSRVSRSGVPLLQLTSHASTVNRSDSTRGLSHSYSVASSQPEGRSPPGAAGSGHLPERVPAKKRRMNFLDTGIDTAERRHGASSPFVGSASAVRPVQPSEWINSRSSHCTAKKGDGVEPLSTDDKKFQTPTFAWPVPPQFDALESRQFSGSVVGDLGSGEGSLTSSSCKGQAKEAYVRDEGTGVEAMVEQGSADRPWKVARTLYEADSDDEEEEEGGDSFPRCNGRGVAVDRGATSHSPASDRVEGTLKGDGIGGSRGLDGTMASWGFEVCVTCCMLCKYMFNY
jgi:hypothetical protein